jgi:hypothetical protein
VCVCVRACARAVLIRAVLRRFLKLCFPSKLLRYSLNDLEIVPGAPVIIHINFIFTFHISSISIVASLYSNILQYYYYYYYHYYYHHRHQSWPFRTVITVSWRSLSQYNLNGLIVSQYSLFTDPVSLTVLSRYRLFLSRSTLAVRIQSLSQYSVFTTSVSLKVLSFDGPSLSQYSL